ncbi:MAG: hypothetical protein LBD22_03885, partial [Spirochaetaceae bacterium]|nr:hypothetical protein [Spirochaetaceae bacterium]
MKKNILGVLITLLCASVFNACMATGFGIDNGSGFTIAIDENAVGVIFADKKTASEGENIKIWSTEESLPTILPADTSQTSTSILVSSDGLLTERYMLNKLGLKTAWAFHFNMPASNVTIGLNNKTSRNDLVTRIKIVHAGDP